MARFVGLSPWLGVLIGVGLCATWQRGAADELLGSIGYADCSSSCDGWLFRSRSGLHPGPLPGQECKVNVAVWGEWKNTPVEETWNLTAGWWWDSEQGAPTVTVDVSSHETTEAEAKGHPPQACSTLGGLPGNASDLSIQLCLGFEGKSRGHGLTIDATTYGTINLLTRDGPASALVHNVTGAPWSTACKDFQALFLVAIILGSILICGIPCACYACVCPRARRRISHVLAGSVDRVGDDDARDPFLDERRRGSSGPHPGAGPIPVPQGRMVTRGASDQKLPWVRSFSLASSGISGHGEYVPPGPEDLSDMDAHRDHRDIRRGPDDGSDRDVRRPAAELSSSHPGHRLGDTVVGGRTARAPPAAVEPAARPGRTHKAPQAASMAVPGAWKPK